MVFDKIKRDLIYLFIYFEVGRSPPYPPLWVQSWKLDLNLN